jgi:hypothetical protein
LCQFTGEFSTMERLMANPMPLPCGLVVKKAAKI